MSSVLARYHLYPTGWLIHPFAIKRNGNKGRSNEVPKLSPPYSQALTPCLQQVSEHDGRLTSLKPCLTIPTQEMPSSLISTCEQQTAGKASSRLGTRTNMAPLSPTRSLQRVCPAEALGSVTTAPGRAPTGPSPQRPPAPQARARLRAGTLARLGAGGAFTGAGAEAGAAPAGRCPPARRCRPAHPASRMTLLSPQSQAPPAWLRNML